MSARPRLSRALIVETAAELLDAAGGADVTLAEIAAKLGVRTPSLYNHISGLDELRYELAIYGVKELGIRMSRAAIGKSGDDAVRAVAEAYRAYAHERPGLSRTTLRAAGPDDTALEAVSQEVLTILRLVLQHYGLSAEDEIHAIRALRSIVYGFSSLELAGGFGLPTDVDESFRRMLDVYILGLRHAYKPVAVSESAAPIS